MNRRLLAFVIGLALSGMAFSALAKDDDAKAEAGTPKVEKCTTGKCMNKTADAPNAHDRSPADTLKVVADVMDPAKTPSGGKSETTK